MSGGVGGKHMKIIFTATLEIKRNPGTKKKSPAQQKPTAQSNSLKNTIIVNQK
jgi:hypothetical protein